MVLALNEYAINNRLAVVSGTTHHLPDTWDISGDDDDWTLKVDHFEPPQIDFNTTIKNGCRLKMTVKTGKLSFETIKKIDGKKQIVTEEIPLNGITFFITTQVSSITHEQFSDELFQVQSLFADLTKVHDVNLESTSQEIRAKISGATESSLKTLIGDQITKIGQENPQALLFGSVKIPTISEPEKTHGPLAPTASSYSVTKRIDNAGNYIDGSLNYLLWLDKSDLPQGDAVGAFNETLLLYDGQKHQYAPGTLVISDYALLEKFVKPELITKYTNGERTPNFTVDHRQGDVAAKLYLTNNDKYIYEEHGDDHVYFTKLNAESKSENHNIRIDYEIDVRRDHWSGDVKAEGTGYAELSFSYLNGKLDTSVNAPEPSVHVHQDWATRILGDFITFGFDEIGIDDRRDEARDQIKNLGSHLGSAIEQVLNLIELPGKSVFAFDYAELNGNLYIRTRYDD